MLPDVRKVGSVKRRVRRYLFLQTDEKWHAAVARSTFSRQNAQNTTISDQFLKLRCPKIARCCGAKHICKSKCTKHRTVGAIFDVPMFKSGTPLWREAYFQVNMYKTPQGGTNFGSSDPEKLHAAVARSTFVSQNVQNTTISDQFLKLRCPKIARCCGAKHICKSKCTKHRTVGAIFDVPMFKNGTPLWREAYFQVNMYKTPQGGTRKNCTPLWREAHL